MYFYEVSPVGIVRADSAFFTYHSDIQLTIGQIVTIEVGQARRIGVVTSAAKKPTYQTKSITKVVEHRPLPAPLIELAQWLSKYYATHLGAVWQTVLPRGLQKQRRQKSLEAPRPIRNVSKFELTNDQKTAIRLIDSSPATLVLHGVTGSGKTQVYIEAAKKAAQRGESSLILTPEISLTSQLVDNFLTHFDNVVVTHSRQTEAERHLIWQRILNNDQPLVVVGPRSALFMPIQKIGLIVIDESHEPSYQQEQSPRYHASRAARILADQHQARLILGSATPSIADYHNAQQAKSPIVKMSTPALTQHSLEIELIDMSKRNNFQKHRFLSNQLIDGIQTTLQKNQQVLLFHNRRGSASVTLCENCGWQAGCPNCFLPLTLHSDKHLMRCHICNFTSQVPTSCPSCGGVQIIHKGVGTKLIEQEIRQLFPDHSIARFDGDTTFEDSVAKRYAELYSGEISIVIGTQVVAKGLDLPKLSLVGIIQADAGLSLPDFGASERTFQLLAQAIGRVGRSALPSRAIVQSFQPDHPAVHHGLSQDYSAFFEFALKERRRAHFPPFTHLLKLTCIYKTETSAIKRSRELAAILKAKLPDSVQVLGPTPAFYERQGDTFRWQLVLKSTRRQQLIDCLQYVPPKHWQFELDPISLL